MSRIKFSPPIGSLAFPYAGLGHHCRGHRPGGLHIRDRGKPEPSRMITVIEGVADDVDVLIPGHGSVCGSDQVRARIEMDRAYLQALGDGHAPDDPRIDPTATFGRDWLPGVYEWQRQQLAPERERDGSPG